MLFQLSLLKRLKEEEKKKLTDRDKKIEPPPIPRHIPKIRESKPYVRPIRIRPRPGPIKSGGGVGNTIVKGEGGMTRNMQYQVVGSTDKYFDRESHKLAIDDPFHKSTLEITKAEATNAPQLIIKPKKKSAVKKKKPRIEENKPGKFAQKIPEYKAAELTKKIQDAINKKKQKIFVPPVPDVNIAKAEEAKAVGKQTDSKIEHKLGEIIENMYKTLEEKEVAKAEKTGPTINELRNDIMALGNNISQFSEADKEKYVNEICAVLDGKNELFVGERAEYLKAELGRLQEMKEKGEFIRLFS
ncbi:MAG: hypothetical protein ABIH83_05335 [Candidatus Micrarchaeota archaeon]